MISKKHNAYLILSSIVTTVGIIGGSLFIYTYTSAFGTNGIDTAGLKYEISMAQLASPSIKPIKSIQEQEEDKIKEPNRPADISTKTKIKIKKKKKPVKKARKAQKARKQIIDKATLGKLNLIYARTLQSTIKRHMIIPRNLLSTKTVHIRFRINGDGNIILLNVHKSSGRSSVDEIALKTVRLASPFPKPPVALRHTDMTYIIPMTYELSK